MTAEPVPDRSAFTFNAAAALIVFLFILFPLVLSASIYREWTETQKRAEDRALAASQVVATNARWITELSRQALARMDEALGLDVGANVDATAVLIREAVGTLPGNVKAYVVAADGRTLFSTDPNLQPIDVRDRAYFAEVAAGGQWYISPLLVSRLDGAQIFVFSKRLERDGRFVGAAIISFDVALFREVWSSLELDELSAVSILREDGQLVARYPLADGPLDLSGYVLFTNLLRNSAVGTYPALSPADGISRIVAYRRIEGKGLVAVASISTQAAFALFRRNTTLIVAFALPTALALAGAIGWIFRLLRIDQQRRLELSEAVQLNRMLVRDTHHRVKNNLQAIMSMVRMHAVPREMKLDLQRRISAMSSVHEHLYRLDKFEEVSAASLIPGIIDPLVAAYGEQVEVRYEIAPLIVGHDQATPLALLVSELVTNSLKYAFRQTRQPRISISLQPAAEGGADLIVADNGEGFDPDAPSNGLGTRLIKAMLTQLGGSGSYAFDQGTSFLATLPTGIDAAPADPGHPAITELRKTA